MKKRAILLTIMLLLEAYMALRPAYAASGTTDIILSIPTQYAATVLDAFNWAGGARISLDVEKEGDPPQMVRVDFTIAAKDPNETQLAYGKRVAAVLVRAIVVAKATYQRQEDQRAAAQAAMDAVPTVSVPDDIVQ